ncbi:MAG: CBS domain-containing protein [Cytophagales bacterium]|nr:CBS domain-containing protein [Cytophagales bacterium]
MELYLDSADLKEIETAFELGVLTGLTTTPTFIHREGITDVDGVILKLSKMVPILQVEALGENSEEICHEANRLISLGLNKHETVFKIPINNEGIKACKQLSKEGFLVNIHLVYTLQQAYMAMIAGATYVCPLIGRLQDEGNDALSLVSHCVAMVQRFNASTKIMFSSVRHAEHVRNAINLGAHACTVPWKVMKNLTQNNFTKVGIQQFVAHTNLMKMRVSEVIQEGKPTVALDTGVTSALVEMTVSGLGVVAVVDKEGKVVGAFTDGDLRRYLQKEGEQLLKKKMADFTFKKPIAIMPDALLYDAVNMFKTYQVDNLFVVDQEDKLVGILDIQDLLQMNLIS